MQPPKYAPLSAQFATVRVALVFRRCVDLGVRDEIGDGLEALLVADAAGKLVGFGVRVDEHVTGVEVPPGVGLPADLAPVRNEENHPYWLLLGQYVPRW